MHISNIYAIGVPEGDKEWDNKKNLKKIMSKSLQNFMKHIHLQIQEACWSPRSINTNTEGGVKMMEE